MKVSVVIPNRNDTVMLSITVKSVLEELKAVDGGGEVVIADNSDNDIWELLITQNKTPLDLTAILDGQVKLLRQKRPGLYAARESAIRHSSGEYCLNLDSHMILGRDSIKTAVEFMDKADKKIGFVFSPIGWLDRPARFARHDINVGNGTIFGHWGRQYDKPTRICWNFGFHICRKDWFIETIGGYGCYARDHISWGGGEFYTAIKSLLLGFENWAIPSAPVYHIGPFAKEIERQGYRYRLYGNSGSERNGMGVLIAFYALAGDAGIEEAKKAKTALAQYGIDTERDWPIAKRYAETDWEDLNAKKVMSLSELVKCKPWKAGGWKDWDPLKGVNVGAIKGLIKHVECGR